MSEAIKRRGRPPTFDRAVGLEAAVELFWRHGYEGTSIAMLTEAMGATPPTLYAAFGSKAALYREAVTAYLARPGYGGMRPARAPGSPARSPYETVARYLHGAVDEFTQPTGPKGCMVASGVLQCGTDSQDAAETVAEARRTGIARFVDQLEAAKQGGDLPADVDCTALARFYTAVLQGLSAQAIDGAEPADLHAIVDAALRAWPR